MVPGRTCAAYFGVCNAGINSRFLRSRGMDSSDNLPFYTESSFELPIADIHSFFGSLVTTFAEVAQRNIYGACCLKAGC